MVQSCAEKLLKPLQKQRNAKIKQVQNHIQASQVIHPNHELLEMSGSARCSQFCYVPSSTSPQSAPETSTNWDDMFVTKNQNRMEFVLQLRQCWKPLGQQGRGRSWWDWGAAQHTVRFVWVLARSRRKVLHFPRACYRAGWEIIPSTAPQVVCSRPFPRMNLGAWNDIFCRK